MIQVQFMVETANSIQHRSSKTTVTLLSVVTLILFEVLERPRVRIQPL